MALTGARPQLSKVVVVHGRVGVGLKGEQPPSCESPREKCTASRAHQLCLPSLLETLIERARERELYEAIGNNIHQRGVLGAAVAGLAWPPVRLRILSGASRRQGVKGKGLPSQCVGSVERVRRSSATEIPLTRNAVLSS